MTKNSNLALTCQWKVNGKTILPLKLFKQLQQLSVHGSLCHWILGFLLHRKQVGRVNSKTPRVKYISTGTPQGCVLSPLLYSLYTNDCVSHTDSVKIHLQITQHWWVTEMRSSH